ncbi:MAG: purine-nucleoside phosphorylase [Chloroflexota bacterium]|nr:purine-nucleoside phosphorylase [Chloroflexota bacterium]
MKHYTMEDFQATAAVIRQRTSLEPKIGMILGSGLNHLADSIEDATIIPYQELPNYPVSTVQGHAGRLVLGTLANRPVMVMQGRGHFYEGYPITQVGFPIRVMQVLGVKTLIVTNAAGGVNITYKPGEVMIIHDHINLLGMAGQNPLYGPNIDELGPRFPSMNEAYTPALREKACEIARENGIPYHKGVYICLAGPSFETLADVRFLRAIGVDAVGMSTVPEVITARHGGMQVLGLSGITNSLVGEEGAPPPNHEEVLEAGVQLVPRLETLVRGILESGLV